MSPHHAHTATTKHLPWIDACKGIGILLVVLGHVTEDGFLNRFLYLFHMPLFFFLSGYLHTAQADFRDFFRRKSIHLLLPYVSFLVLLYPAEVFHVLKHGADAHSLGYHALTLLWGGNQMQGLYGVFWFLTCLFATQQVVNWLLVKCSLATTVAVVLCGLLASYANSVFFPWFGLPLDLNVCVAAMPFFLAGYLWRRFTVDKWWIAPAAAAGVGFALWEIKRAVPLAYNMRGAAYGVPVLSFVLALCCIFCVVKISQLLRFAPPIRKLMERFGAASMGIMFIHKVLPVLPGLGRLVPRHPWVALVLFSAISYAFTMLLLQFRWTRALLMGSQKDFALLVSRKEQTSRHEVAATYNPRRTEPGSA